MNLVFEQQLLTQDIWYHHEELIDHEKETDVVICYDSVFEVSKQV